VAATGSGEYADFRAGQIGERVALEIAPSVFNRVQLRSIGREVNLPPLPYLNKDRDAEVTMDSGTIPDQQQRIVKVAGELAEKSQPRQRIEVFIDQQLKIQTHFAPVRTDAQGGDGGDLLRLRPTCRSTGVCPHRLQVRRTTGSRSSPLSSRKTSHPFRRQAFF